MEQKDILELGKKTFMMRKKINERVGKEFDLPPIEVEMIYFLYLCSDPTATEIGQKGNFKKNTISVHVENLVQSGFIERNDMSGDRRKVKLSLTPKAFEVAERCCKEYGMCGQKLIEGLTCEQLEEMARCFDVIDSNAAKLLKNELT